MNPSRLTSLLAGILAGLCGCSTAPKYLSPPPGLPWRVELGGSGSSQISGLATQDGDLFAIGSFEGETFLRDQRLLSAGGQDVFVARLGPDTRVRWVRRWGGSGDDLGQAIEAGADGSLLVTGNLTGAADLEGARTGAGGPDCFVAKLKGADGQVQWVRRFGGAGGSDCRSAAYDSAGDVFVTGRFDGEVDLGFGPRTSAGLNDLFLVKLSGQDGTPRWAQVFGGAGDDIGRDVAVAPSGTLLLTGHFSSNAAPAAGAVDFGAGLLTSAGDSDAFLAAFSGDGRCLWSRAFGGPNFDMAKSVVPASDGTLFLTGLFQGEVKPQPGEILFSAGGFEGFISHLTERGEELWRHRYPTLTSGHALALTPSGEVVMVGHFTATLELGADRKLQSQGKNDVAGVLFSPAGDVRWTDHDGTFENDYGYAVTTAAGGVVLGGILTEATGGDASKPRTYGFISWSPLPSQRALTPPSRERGTQ
ncbi:hypothetical protein [Hyalangium minutum]|uniref:Beta-propeller repeat protein n=1 Tax=Hyalangium minutum TaxID=394096 RepID=A0A085W060_9BACT|nr:hypothetical protein [Hyalangium minutum]KFE61073.1 hypothetical protein DB31_4508 [Hyalangium minutum]